MAAESSGPSPDKRCKYDEASKAGALRLTSESRSTPAAARQLGISPKLLYRWQQAQLVAEVGSVEVARDPGSGPRVRPTSGWRRNSTFKKSLGLPNALGAFSASRPREHLSAHRPVD